jgi:hypothetical protein
MLKISSKVTFRVIGLLVPAVFTGQSVTVQKVTHVLLLLISCYNSITIIIV